MKMWKLCLLMVAMLQLGFSQQLVNAADEADAKRVRIDGYVDQIIVLEVAEPDEVRIDRRDIVNYFDNAPPEETRILVQGVAPGAAEVRVVKDNQITYFDIYIQDPAQADQTKIIKTLVGDQGLEVRFVNEETLVLEGEVEDDLMLRKALNLANTFAPGNVLNFVSVRDPIQVQIKVSMVEINNNRLSRMGLQYRSDDQVVDGLTVPLGISPTSFLPFFNVINSRVFGDPSATEPQVDLIDVEASLNLMATKGIAKILQEPTLTVINGQAASFRVGGEFPIETVTFVDGTRTVSVEYIPFGIQLLVTPILEEAGGWNPDGTIEPHDTFGLNDSPGLPVQSAPMVDRNGMIRLYVRPELSEPDFSRVDAGTATFPTLSTKFVETRVALRDNQALVIGGLFDENMQSTLERIPFISRIPVLGELFKNRNNDNERQELVFVVRPKIIRQKQVGTPAYKQLPQRDKLLTQHGNERGQWSTPVKPTRISASEIWLRPDETPQDLMPVDESLPILEPKVEAEPIEPTPEPAAPEGDAAPEGETTLPESNPSAN